MTLFTFFSRQSSSLIIDNLPFSHSSQRVHISQTTVTTHRPIKTSGTISSVARNLSISCANWTHHDSVWSAKSGMHRKDRIHFGIEPIENSSKIEIDASADIYLLGMKKFSLLGSKVIRLFILLSIYKNDNRSFCSNNYCKSIIHTTEKATHKLPLFETLLWNVVKENCESPLFSGNSPTDFSWLRFVRQRGQVLLAS